MRLPLLHLERRKNHDFSAIEIFAGVWYGLVLETLATLGNGTIITCVGELKRC